jgi:peptidoglycan/LPS O-acetylase OafA/YrhL
MRSPVKSAAYRADVNGLRAVAMLSVLLCHAHLGLPGGYVGVDVFFVISGYLITGLIIHALEKQTFSLIEFWERPIRRVFPAMAAMTVATMAVGWFVRLHIHLNLSVPPPDANID